MIFQAYLFSNYLRGVYIAVSEWMCMCVKGDREEVGGERERGREEEVGNVLGSSGCRNEPQKWTLVNEATIDFY